MVEKSFLEKKEDYVSNYEEIKKLYLFFLLNTKVITRHLVQI
jgi:hypothetical protein